MFIFNSSTGMYNYNDNKPWQNSGPRRGGYQNNGYQQQPWKQREDRPYEQRSYQKRDDGNQYQEKRNFQGVYEQTKGDQEDREIDSTLKRVDEDEFKGLRIAYGHSFLRIVNLFLNLGKNLPASPNGPESMDLKATIGLEYIHLLATFCNIKDQLSQDRPKCVQYVTRPFYANIRVSFGEQPLEEEPSWINLDLLKTKDRKPINTTQMPLAFFKNLPRKERLDETGESTGELVLAERPTLKKHIEDQLHILMIALCHYYKTNNKREVLQADISNVGIKSNVQKPEPKEPSIDSQLEALIQDDPKDAK